MDDPLKWMKVPEPLVSRLGDAAALIESTRGPIRIISHYDGDGICSAGIMAKAVSRMGKRFHATMTNVLNDDEIASLEGGFELLVVTDMGSTLAPEISGKVIELQARCIILDHHIVDGRKSPYSISDGGGVIEINPRFHEINGTSGCSGSTLSFLMAVTMDPGNLDLCIFSLAGSLADRQHVPAFSELNLGIRNLALENGYLEASNGMPFSGRNMLEALLTSNDPFIDGLSGKEEAVGSLLNQMGIDPEQGVRDVDPEKMKVLQSYLYVKLLKDGVKPQLVHELFREEFYSGVYGPLQDLAYAIDGCGRYGKTSQGFSVVWGSMEAYEKALRERFEYKRHINELLRRQKDRGVDDMEHIQWFVLEEETLSGTIAGLGHNYLFDHNKPMLALAKGDNGTMNVSSRGDRELCRRGLDLGTVMREAGRMNGGGGGGHDVAAGAHFPEENMESFLDMCDRLVGEQMRKKR